MRLKIHENIDLLEKFDIGTDSVAKLCNPNWIFIHVCQIKPMKSGSRFVGLNFSQNYCSPTKCNDRTKCPKSTIIQLPVSGSSQSGSQSESRYTSYLKLGFQRSNSAVFTCKSKLTDNPIVNHKESSNETYAVNSAQRWSKYICSQKWIINIFMLEFRSLQNCTHFLEFDSLTFCKFCTRTCVSFARQMASFLFLWKNLFVCLYQQCLLFVYLSIVYVCMPKFVCRLLLSLRNLCLILFGHFSKEIFRCFVLVHRRYSAVTYENMT